jgi:hypothetical protein
VQDGVVGVGLEEEGRPVKLHGGIVVPGALTVTKFSKITKHLNSNFGF